MMNYRNRLDQAFKNAPILPLDSKTKYVFFSDCHRGSGNNNDNFLKNSNSYLAAIQYYYQHGFYYVEAGDGDELWENCTLHQIADMHQDVFEVLCQFHTSNRLCMLYGNHDMIKKDTVSPIGNLTYYEGLIFQSDTPALNLYVTHGHQADFLNSILWKYARFMVRHLWTPLEHLGISDPTSAAKNNTKKEKLEKRYLSYAKESNILLLTGHTHRPTLGNHASPYYNCGSCVHPKCITCIELCGYHIRLVRWCSSTKISDSSPYNAHAYSPIYPVYIRREVLASASLL